MVSVIMIFLNTEQFIQEAIESVFAQTYADWELLLVDDGSTDRSSAIARRCAEQHPEKVRYLEHPDHQNRGMSASRNLGISKARGTYIAFLDADDVWFPNTLQQQVTFLEAQPDAGMVYGSTQMWYSWTGNLEDAGRDHMRKLGVQPDRLYQPPALLPLFLRGEAQTPGTCSILVRRELIERIGGFEAAFRGMYEDQVFVAKVCLHASVFITNTVLSRYRQHPASYSAVAKQTGYYYSIRPNLAHLTFLKWLKAYMLQHELKDPAVWKALQTALWPYRQPVLYHIVQRVRHPMNQIMGLLLLLAQAALPVSIHHRLQTLWRARKSGPSVGAVRFGSLRRVTPMSRTFGFDRGQPIDRYYIDRFLATYAADIKGRVLEIGDNTYTRTFGGDRVTQSDVLHATEGNPQATFVGDLTRAEHIPSNAFDCVILTQTLQYIYDLRTAIATIYRILKPGGVVLVTVPGISQFGQDPWSQYWCWNFTTRSAQQLFAEAFSAANVIVGDHGNVLAATAFLYGLATQELRQQELDAHDPQYEVLITVRAVKPRAT